VDEHELSARLPAPRADEPASLRQDIIDELSDHLHSAMRRELLVERDHEAARRHVLTKFGDPAAVARTLWFQAMWSTIMSQRLMLGAFSATILLCVVLTAAVVWLIGQQHAAATQQQLAIAQLMEQMARMKPTEADSATRSVPAASSIQSIVTIGGADGPPAHGYSVTLQQLGFEGNKSIAERTDSNGSVDFGYCSPARYQIGVTTPWGYGWTKRFVLHPSTAHIEKIICPAEPPEARVSPLANLPEDLKDAHVVALVRFEPGQLTMGEDIWREAIPGSDRRFLAVGQGEFGFFLSIGEGPFGPVSGPADPRRWAIFTDESRPKQPPPRLFAGVRYPVYGLRLVRLAVNRKNEPPTVLPKYEQVAPKPPEAPRLVRPLELEFVADANKPSEWIIPIPDELIEQARQYLREQVSTAESSPAAPGSAPGVQSNQ
jgi:hypothetical protein